MGGKITKQVSQLPLKRISSSGSNTGNTINYEDTTSITTSIMSASLRTYTATYSFTNFDTSYLYMDGRKFYRDDNSIYILPSDSIETQRTDFAHELYKRRWHNNFSSPVKEKLQSSEGGTVLDCGCGSGKWSYEMAVKYPSSTFIGLDMVPVFSDISDGDHKPLNLGFLEYNVCNRLPFQNATFDFVFQRGMIVSLNKAQWRIMLDEFARTIKPGGWLELMELRVNEINLTGTAKIFQKALNTYLEVNDHYPYNKFPFHDLLESTNQFTSIKVIQKQIPIGNWGGEFGLKVADILIEVFKGMKPTLKQIIDVTDFEYDELLYELSKEAKSPLNDYMYVNTVRAFAMRI